ncbi:AAA family ATPase [Lysobacter korlensis]|uniref:AAA family ATPase n=1 Tax=Lysobacter korlensis TaxID=553636 RepID=A0ABV6RP14_9GAMM
MIVGRDPELRAVRALLERARGGDGGALVVHGEAGVGKSTLLAEAVRQSSGFRVLRTRGNEAESPLAYAALHRLLRPLLGRVGRLPRPQAQALGAVFGLEAGGAVGSDRFLVFLAALGLLTDAAEDDPIFCVVDDAHWLDDASAAALRFIARRVEFERIAMVFGARDGGLRRFDPEELATLHLAGLDAESAERLLLDAAPAPVPAAVVSQLVARTHGNPLALVELPAALTLEQLVGEAALPAHLPLTDGLERVFLERFRGLSEDGRTLLLLAAADDSGDLLSVRRAAELLGAAAGLPDAERSGLLEVTGTTVELRHPLVRSAVYTAATSVDRRRAHQALADSFTERGDPDRAVWHRADALESPDEATAAELDRVARWAGQNGGHEAASAAWERAADLSRTPGERASRRHCAALSAWLAGQPNRARTLVQSARAEASDPELLADIDSLRAFLEMNFGSPRVGHGILMSAARDVAGHDPARARKLAMVATAFAAFGFDSGIGIDPVSVAPPADDDDPLAQTFGKLLAGMAAIVRKDTRDAAAQLRQALATAQGLRDPDLLTNIGIAAVLVGDDDAAMRWHDIQLDEGRQRAALSAILHALTRRTIVQLAVGRFPAVGTAAAEVLEIAGTTGQVNQRAFPLAEQALLAALQGSDRFADKLADAEQALAAHPAGVLDGLVRDTLEWAKAVDATTPAVALHHLQRVSHSAMARIIAIDRMEAAIRADKPDDARAVAADLAAFAADTGAAWAAAAAEHGRALLAEGDDAERHFRSALARSPQNTRLFNRARTELAYGEFLRRARRRTDAREHLRSAFADFETLGVRRWADRAAEELRASGESLRKREDSAVSPLTPQELQVARLVQQGLANRDVAARLFVSPRTVDFHLRNVFAKLGITSRGALTQIDLDHAA